MTTFCFVFYEAYLSTERRMQRRKREGEFTIYCIGDSWEARDVRGRGRGRRGRRPEEDQKKTGSRRQVEGVSK
jgi:hypothetical protein